MKLVRLLPFLLLASLAFGTATVSGKLQNPDTTGAVPGFVQFDLQNCGGNAPTVSGATIAPQQKFTLNADGTWSGVMARNDEISCNGSFTTWWHKSYFVNFRQVGPAMDYLCSQASCVFDGTGGLTPITTYPAPPAPAQPLTGAESVVCSFPAAASTWTCTENMGTQQVVAEFFDLNSKQIFPDQAQATDVNTFVGTFLQPQTGFMRVVNVGNWTPSSLFPNYIIANPVSSQSINTQPFTFNGPVSFLGGIPHISNENGIIAVDGTTYSTPQAAITACLAATNCGEVYVPAGLYTSSSLINCSAASGHFLRIRGAGMDSSFGTILRFTGATDGLQLNANCTAEDLNIDTSNALGGIGLRFSGLDQYIRNIQVTASGFGAWAKQIQALGPVTGKLQTSYTTSTGGPIGLDIICNGVCPSGATGALELDGDEFRSSGTGVHLNGALSVVMFGGSVENNTTNGILADTNASQLAIYGTHMEQNGTNDINWLTGGHLSIFETIHPGGTTNIINCPNTTCTAQVRIYGLISQNTAANLILGNTVTNGTLYGSNIAGSHLTIGKASAVCVFGNTSLDSTNIANTLCYDGTVTRWTFQYPTGPTSGYIDISNTRMLFNFGGVNAFQVDGSGNVVALNSFKTASAVALQLTGGGQAIRGTGSPNDNSFIDLGNLTFRNSDANNGGSITVGPITVASLPAAAAGNKGQMRIVSDSTAVAAEGQTCAGSSTNTALAFSNGTAWKCF